MKGKSSESGIMSPPLPTLSRLKLALLATVVVLLTLAVFASPVWAATRTWDGGGVTNNWSEAANWSGDAVPVAGDVAVFDGTSTKDATIDTNFSLAGLQINAGYTGTITQAGGVNLTLDSFYSQADGTFNAPSGTMFLAGGFNHTAGGTFNANGGTVIFDAGGDQNVRVNGSETFNNLTINLGSSFGGFTLLAGDRLISTGTLTLTNGFLDNATLEAQGNISVASTFDGGTGPLLISGDAARTITVPEGARLPNTTLNAANVTLNTSGTITGGNFTLQAGTVQQGTANFSPNFYSQTGGTYTGGSGNLTTNGLSQSGGVFNGGSGNVDINANSFTLSGGTFNAPSSTTFISGFGLAHTVGGTFNHNGGTVVFDSNFDQGISNTPNAALTVFNNLTITAEGAGGGGITLGSGPPPRIAGTLSLVKRFLSNSLLEARGDVSVASTFNGGTTGLSFTGPANQTYTNAGGTNLSRAWTIDKPSNTVTLASDLDLSNASSLNLTNGTITTGANKVNLGNSLVTRTGGHVIGNLQRGFTAAGAKTFDVGTANGYSPVTVNATAGTGSFTVGATQGSRTPPMVSPRSLQRFWTLTSNGITQADLTFKYLDADVPATLTENNMVFFRIDGGGAANNQGITTLDTAGNTATLNGVTAFSDWTLADLNQQNGPPENSVPGPQTTDEDEPLGFSTANGNAVSVSDPDAGSDPIRAALSVNSGALTLGGTAGLTFSQGDGTADQAMTFTGAQSAINAALNGLTYAPAQDFNGSDTLTITTNDQGNTGTGGAQEDTDTVQITVNPVNDSPVAANDGVFKVRQGKTLKVNAPGLLANDTDPDAQALKVADGNTSDTDLAGEVDPVSGPSKGTLTLREDGSFVYKPKARGLVTFTYKASDGTADSNIATVTIKVRPR